ncbi:TrkH family potassium uptake protein [Marinilabilia sp.]
MGVIRNTRERINVLLFDIRDNVFRVVNIFSLLVTIAGLVVIVRFFGYSPDEETSLHLTNYLQRILDFFFLRFCLRVFFDFNPKKFLKNNFWESVIMLFIVSESIVFFIFGEAYWLSFARHLGMTVDGYFLFVQLLFWLIVVREMGRISFNIGDFRISPAAMLALSFLTLIAVGTILLKMPEMTVNPVSWTDALFTSTSACFVTGLIVQDTATFFTFKGQLVIMLLFQLGGLNMLTIATFIGTFYRRSGSLHAVSLIRDFLDTQETGSLRSILRRVVFYSLAFELAGALLLFFLWGSNCGFNSTGERIYYSLFHAISAFNNAGFSLFTEGLFQQSVRYQYGVHLVIMVLIVAGGLGFIVLQDVFSTEKRRFRKTSHWRRLMVNSRLVLTVSGIFILSGAILFFIFEYHHSLKDSSLWGKIIASFFQSVTTRTAGFNTVDMGQLSLPTLLVFMLFMFVGASPGSTGGGIKTTTFAVALKAAWANIKGKEHVEIYRRNIRWASVNKTYAIIAMALSFLFVFSILLMVTNPQFSLKEILFEQVSAMGTVGLSLGITGDLSQLGKIILVVSMFVGRIGTLTMGIIFSRRVIAKNYRYPNARLMIG